VAEARIDRHSAVVEQDLPDIYTFIAAHDPAAAERVLDGVEETFRLSCPRRFCHTTDWLQVSTSNPPTDGFAVANIKPQPRKGISDIEHVAIKGMELLGKAT
jgi:hypothetical protein